MTKVTLYYSSVHEPLGTFSSHDILVKCDSITRKPKLLAISFVSLIFSFLFSFLNVTSIILKFDFKLLLTKVLVLQIIISNFFS